MNRSMDKESPISFIYSCDMARVIDRFYALVNKELGILRQRVLQWFKDNAIIILLNPYFWTQLLIGYLHNSYFFLFLMARKNYCSFLCNFLA